MNSVVMLIHLARTLGLPVWENPEDDLDIYGHLADAGARSMTAQTLRNKKGSA